MIELDVIKYFFFFWDIVLFGVYLSLLSLDIDERVRIW